MLNCNIIATRIATAWLLFVTITVRAQDIGRETAPSASLTLKKLSIEELMDVEVTTVSRRPEKLTEAASAIQVITNDDIRRSGATSLPEALRLAPNLQVAQVNASEWAISARGFNNTLANKLLVMIDGRIIYTPLYAGVFWDAQNLLLEDIDRIEVISGPGGTLWGANAVNGVINIITKSAVHTQGLFIEAGAGTELQGYGGIRYGGKIGKEIYYRVYGTAFKRGSTLSAEGNDANDDWTMAQGGFQFDWGQDKNHFTLQSNLYDNRPNPDGTIAVQASGQNVLGRWNRTLSENSDIKLQVYFDRTLRDFRNGLSEKLNTYDFDGHHRFHLGKRQEVVWGLGYRLMDDNVQNAELLKFEPPQKNLHVYNIFIQDKISIIKERLDLTIGAKVEHNSYTNWQFQPSSRLAFALTKEQTLWGAISRALRNPSRIDRDFMIYSAPGDILLNSNNSFRSEEVLAYELGWRMQAASTFTLSVATFYNRYQNLRTVEPGPPPQNVPLILGNGVEGETYGAELAGTYQLLNWWQLRGGYTFLKKDLSVKAGSRDLNSGSVESNDPEHQLLFQSMMDLPSNIEFGLTTRYIDELPRPVVASYWGLDARLGWKPNHVIELNIVGQNLLNNRHAEFGAPSSRNVIERSIYGKIVCHF
jgi:iron complex outermembrane receptor protein